MGIYEVCGVEKHEKESTCPRWNFLVLKGEGEEAEAAAAGVGGLSPPASEAKKRDEPAGAVAGAGDFTLP
jgi:hypothetical protein